MEDLGDNIVTYTGNASAAVLNLSSMNVTDKCVTNITTEQSPLKGFQESYKGIHGYLATCVCTFGIVLNICNIYVLTRKNMKCSATNILLTALAVFDFLTELTYLPFAVYFYILTDTSKNYGHERGWVYYAITSLHMMNICHTVALWLTVSLATFRYIYVCKHTKAQRWCTVERAYITIAVVVLESILMCIPSFICYSVVDQPPGDCQSGSNRTLPWVGQTEVCRENYGLLKIFTHLIFGGIIKSSACIALVFFTVMLIQSLKLAHERHKTLTNNKPSNIPNKRKERSRTTTMLIVVVLIFVITEFPQGILVLVSSIDEWYFDNIYTSLADFLDIIVLLNSSINFVLYASMSSRFRQTFRKHLIQPITSRFEGETSHKGNYSQVTRNGHGNNGRLTNTTFNPSNYSLTMAQTTDLTTAATMIELNDICHKTTTNQSMLSDL